jgi:acetyl-CoA carboxylase biotin carboxyl carrier protein
MWKIHEIRELIKLFNESSLQEMEVELEGAESKISLKKQEGCTLPSYENIEAYKPAAVKDAKAPIVKEIPKLPTEPKITVQKERKEPMDENNPNLFKIVSPMVGTIYRAPGEDAEPFVKTGDKVEKSTVVCILEAMKLFNEIEADVNGEIVEVLFENGQLVEYGQPLFLVNTK